MSQADDFETLNSVLIRVGIDKILGSLGKSKRKEIKKVLATYYLDIDCCYHRPDVLCMALKMIYGRSYTEIIESI